MIENAVARLCESAAGRQFVYVNNNVVGANSVTGFEVERDGSLTTLPGSPFATGGNSNGFSANIDSIDASADGACLYASNASPGTLSAFAIESDGVLTQVGTVSTSGTNPVGVAVDDVNERVYVANFSSGTIHVYDMQPDCSLVSRGVNFVSPATTPLDLEVSSDGTKLFASCDFSNQVSVFDIGAGGALSHIAGSPFAAGGVEHGITRTPDENSTPQPMNVLSIGSFSESRTSSKLIVWSGENSPEGLSTGVPSATTVIVTEQVPEAPVSA